MEIHKGRAQNPIVQDLKHEQPRFYPKALGVAYGALPQTFEHPDASVRDAFTGLAGDGDPLDALDLSSTPDGAVPLPRTGDVYPLVLIGAVAMVDGDETDWKLLGVRRDDPLLGGVTCVSQLLPPQGVLRADALLARAPSARGLLTLVKQSEHPRSVPASLSPGAAEVGRARLQAALHFFATYKKLNPDDEAEASPVSFAFEGRALEADVAAAVALQGYAHWCALMQAATVRAQAQEDAGALGRARGHLARCHATLDMADMPDDPVLVTEGLGDSVWI